MARIPKAELTGVYGALANLASRTNTALGIESQGFSASCGLKPLAGATSPERRRGGG